MLIFSNKIKKILIWELTVPWEEHVEKAHERKNMMNSQRNAKIMNSMQAVRQLRLAQGVSLQGLFARLYQTLVWQEPEKKKAIETIIKTTERTAK